MGGPTGLLIGRPTGLLMGALTGPLIGAHCGGEANADSIVPLIASAPADVQSTAADSATATTVVLRLMPPLPDLSGEDRNIPEGPANLHACSLIQTRRAHQRAVATGAGNSKTYDLIWETRRYPPKALLGTAYAFATGARLAPGDFEGGKSGAVRVLEKLGFEIQPKG